MEQSSALNRRADDELPDTMRPPSASRPQVVEEPRSVRPRYICPARQREPVMAVELAEQLLDQVMATGGAIAAAVVDCLRGEAIASRTAGKTIDTRALVAGATQLHREATFDTSTESLEEVIVVMSDQLRVLRPLKGKGCSIYLIVDRAQGRIGLARYTLASLSAADAKSAPLDADETPLSKRTTDIPGPNDCSETADIPPPSRIPADLPVAKESQVRRIPTSIAG